MKSIVIGKPVKKVVLPSTIGRSRQELEEKFTKKEEEAPSVVEKREEKISEIKMERFEEFRPRFIKTSFYSTEQIIAESVVEVTKPTLKGEPGDLSDPSMGPNEFTNECATCRGGKDVCPGHMGRIKLERPILNQITVPTITKLLNVVCSYCYHCILPPETIEQLGFNRYTGLKKLDVIYNYCKKSNIQCIRQKDKQKKVIMKSYVGNTLVEQETYVNVEPCKKNFSYTQNKDKKTGLRNIYYIVQKEKHEQPIEETMNLLRGIPEEEARLIGFTENHPKNFIMEYVLVLPQMVLPSTIINGERAINEIVRVYKSIISSNAKLKLNPLDIDQYNNLMKNVYSIFDSTYSYGNKTFGIKKQIEGKKGLIRGNLDAGRTSFSGRAVINADPTLEFDEIGLPEYIRKKLTFPERVFALNIEKIKKLFQEDRVRFVEFGENTEGEFKIFKGKKIKVTKKNLEKFKKYIPKIGDIIHRDTMNGDYVLGNRNPTVHRLSIQCHRVKETPGKNIRLNMAVTGAYNADFDGDEMNLHIPTSITTKVEISLILGVDNNILSERDSKPIMGLNYEVLTASYLMTRIIYTSIYSGENIVIRRENFGSLNKFYVNDSSQRLLISLPVNNIDTLREQEKWRNFFVKVGFNDEMKLEYLTDETKKVYAYTISNKKIKIFDENLDEMVLYIPLIYKYFGRDGLTNFYAFDMQDHIEIRDLSGKFKVIKREHTNIKNYFYLNNVEVSSSKITDISSLDKTFLDSIKYKEGMKLEKLTDEKNNIKGYIINEEELELFDEKFNKVKLINPVYYRTGLSKDYTYIPKDYVELIDMDGKYRIIQNFDIEEDLFPQKLYEDLKTRELSSTDIYKSSRMYTRSDPIVRRNNDTGEVVSFYDEYIGDSDTFYQLIMELKDSEYLETMYIYAEDTEEDVEKYLEDNFRYGTSTIELKSPLIRKIGKIIIRDDILESDPFYSIIPEGYKIIKTELYHGFYKRCSKHDVVPFSGRGIHSILLPPDFYYNYAKMKIRDGIIISGVHSKKTLGTSQLSIIHILALNYSNAHASKFITEGQFVVKKWENYGGISIGIDDCYPEAYEAMQEDNIQKKLKEMIQEATKYNVKTDNALENRRRQKEYDNYLNQVRDQLSKTELNSLSFSNVISASVESGAKGSASNIAQITNAIGQQFIVDSKPPKEIGGRRCFPHFRRDDDEPYATGFIPESFGKGLKPTSVAFLNEAGRVGTISTAKMTAKTGELNRDVGKMVEQITIGFDNSVVKPGNRNIIIQPEYAYTGLAPERSVTVPVLGNRIYTFIDCDYEINRLIDKYKDKN